MTNPEDTEKNNSTEKQVRAIPVKLTDIVQGAELTPREINQSVNLYRATRDAVDSPQRLGLYGGEEAEVLKDGSTILLEYESKLGERLFAPLLVSVEKLYWLNKGYLDAKYGEEAKILYYAHPSLPEDDQAISRIQNFVKEKLEEGYIIICDQYSDQQNDPIVNFIIEDGPQREVISLGTESVAASLNEYNLVLSFGKDRLVKKSKTLVEVYESTASQEEKDLEIDGPKILTEVSGDMAEKIWLLYKEPFEKNSKNNPINSLFGKEEFMQILANPKIAKSVYVKDGEIVTLGVFSDAIGDYPWMNEPYYARTYPDYYNTRNVYVFPIIVTDESKRGSSYGLDVMNMVATYGAKRGTDAILSFECNEVSMQYIPRLVEVAVEGGGIGNVSGQNKPKSTIIFSGARSIT